MVCTFNGPSPNAFLSNATEFEQTIERLLKSSAAKAKFINLFSQNIKNHPNKEFMKIMRGIQTLEIDIDKKIDEVIIINDTTSACITGNSVVNTKVSNNLNDLKNKQKYLETLRNGTNVRFDDTKYIYNHNIFKMIYLLSGIGYMSFVIFKSVK